MTVINEPMLGLLSRRLWLKSLLLAPLGASSHLSAPNLRGAGTNVVSPKNPHLPASSSGSASQSGWLLSGANDDAGHPFLVAVNPLKHQHYSWPLPGRAHDIGLLPGKQEIQEHNRAEATRLE